MALYLMSLHYSTHLTDDEEDNSHGSAGQRDQHEELKPENQTL